METRFDGMLFGLAQQHEGGVPELFDTFFGFLRRKTDFFSQKEQAEQLVLSSFRKHKAIVEEVEREKRKQEEQQRREREKKLKEDQERAAQSQRGGKAIPTVEEVDDEEAERFLAEKKKQQEAERLAKETKKVESTTTTTAAAATTPTPTTSSSSTSSSSSSTESKSEGVEPNSGNGGKTETYIWTQTLSELEVRVPVPKGTVSRQLSIEIKKTHLKVGLKGQPPMIDGELHKPIKAGDSFWTIEDNELVVIQLQKVNTMEWWKCVLVGEAEIDTSKVQPESSKLGDLDGETRAMVEKMMFDQQQKAMGKPTSDELKKQEMLQKFMEQHPEMDFSNVKVC